MDEGTRTRASHSVVRTRFSSPTLLINVVCYKILLFLQMEGPPIPPNPHEMYFSSISTFVNFVILKYQGMDKTPFETHPKTITAAIISLLLLLYCIRLEEARPQPRFFHSASTTSNGGRSVRLFWSCTLASLVSLLLPHSAWPILYVLCFALSIFELLPSFCGRIWRKFREWLNNVPSIIYIVNWLLTNPMHLTMARICRNQRRIGPRLPV